MSRTDGQMAVLISLELTGQKVVLGFVLHEGLLIRVDLLLTEDAQETGTVLLEDIRIVSGDGISSDRVV